MPGGVAGGVVGTVHSQAQRQRELEAMAALAAMMQPQQGMMPAPYGLPKAPPLPRGEPARPGGYLPPVPPNVPRMRPPNPLEQLTQTILDYAQDSSPAKALGGLDAPDYPRIGPNPYPVGSKIQDALGLDSWVPNLPEGSYGLGPEASEPGLMSWLAELASSPEFQAALEVPLPPFQGGATDILSVLAALDQLSGSAPNYELGGGPDKQMMWGMMADWPGKPSSAFTKRLYERGPLPGRGPVTAKEAIERQVIANLFNEEGNIRKALANIDEVGVTGKKLDTAIQSGVEGYGETMSRAHDMDIPGAGIPVAHPDMQRHIVDVGLTVPDSTLWYPNATEGYRTRLSGDPLAPPLISVTSSGISPYGNTDRGLPILAGHRAGIPLPQIFSDFKMQGSVMGQAQRVLDAEDIFAAMPYGTDAESMARFDHWIRNAPESEVQRLLKKKTGVFPTPKTFNFWRNNAGDARFPTTDSWQGRNAGFSMWDPDVVVQTKNKDPKTGEYKKKIGGWIEPDESQYYSRKLRSPTKQEKGIPLQSEINLIEDFMNNWLAPEYNLDPSAVQAAHWIGGMKMFDKMPEAHLSAPYGHQLDWRLRYAGVPDRGLGDVRPQNEWAQIYEAMLRNKLAKGDQHIIFGKGDPRLPW